MTVPTTTPNPTAHPASTGYGCPSFGWSGAAIIDSSVQSGSTPDT